MAALLLAEADPLAGAVGSAYAATLGFALVYLGEHYVVDLLGGAALTARGAPRRARAGPLLARVGARRGGARANRARGGIGREETMASGAVSTGECKTSRRRRRPAPPAARRAEEMPRVRAHAPPRAGPRGLRALRAAFLYFVLPKFGGVGTHWDRLDQRRAWWIGVAAALEVLSFASYVAFFQGVFVPRGSPIAWRESYQITMAGLAATRLFAAGGAGGVAVTAWALRRSGMDRGARSRAA